MFRYIFGCFTEGGGVGRVLLACNGQRPGMLNLSCNAKITSPQRRVIWPQMAIVLGLRNPDFK